MKKINRRFLLKSITAIFTTAMTPFVANAGVKSALTLMDKENPIKPLPLYIDVLLGQSKAKRQTKIVNHSDHALTITGFNPSSFKSLNGQVEVSVKTPTLPYTLQPGESMPVYAKVSSENSQRSLPVVPNITSEHIAIRTKNSNIKGELMITVFDSQLA